MLDWLAILRLVLMVADKVSTYLSNQQLINAGKDQAIAASLSTLNERVQRANKIAQDINAMDDDAVLRELRKYERK